MTVHNQLYRSFFLKMRKWFASIIAQLETEIQKYPKLKRYSWIQEAWRAIYFFGLAKFTEFFYDTLSQFLVSPLLITWDCVYLKLAFWYVGHLVKNADDDDTHIAHTLTLTHTDPHTHSPRGIHSKGISTQVAYGLISYRSERLRYSNRCAV